MEQIRHKLIDLEGKAKASRIKAEMKWWTKCISMVIAKTASRNVAFKSDKLMDAIFQEGQSLSVAGQTFEVSVKKRLRRLWSRLTFLK